MAEAAAAVALHNCPQCGASVELPVGQLSQLCAFCEAPLVAMPDAGEREPVDEVAPFALDRTAASNRLRAHLQDQRWAPGAVRSASRPEDLAGVLVPFYCYDATARTSYTARVGLYWYRTETYTVWVNGRPQVRTRQVRETEWFSCSGSHVAEYIDHLVSGSRGLPEAEANQLEPFDLGQARPFDPSLLAGWVAERPSVGHDEAKTTANEELARLESSRPGLG